MSKRNRIPTLFALGLGTLTVGCGSSPNSSPGATSNFAVGVPVAYSHAEADTTKPALNLGTYHFVPDGQGLSPSAANNPVIDRKVDYGLALRTAAIKLTGDLPKMSDIRNLQAAVNAAGNKNDSNDPNYVYGQIIRNYIYGDLVDPNADPATGARKVPAAFNNQMVQFFRNTLRMGGTLTGLFQDSTTDVRTVSLETAPTFAASLVANEKDMRLLFTQDSNTCPTFDRTSGTFTAASCAATNNVPDGSQAGVLTDPGFLAQYYSNFGFRRTRLINEIFTCAPLPSELSQAPVPEGDFLYTSTWPFDSVTSADNKPVFDYKNVPRLTRGGSSLTKDFVDFRPDCQNCHATQNHRAPLFGVFDQVGFRNPKNQLMVTSTATDSPFAQIQEYLYGCNPDPANPAALTTCKSALFWKYQTTPIDYVVGTGAPAPNFQAFGKDMAADASTTKCLITRVWNSAYSRDDVVTGLALVPDEVISDLVTSFKANNYNMKTALYQLYTGANFIRF